MKNKTKPKKIRTDFVTDVRLAIALHPIFQPTCVEVRQHFRTNNGRAYYHSERLDFNTPIIDVYHRVEEAQKKVRKTVEAATN